MAPVTRAAAAPATAAPAPGAAAPSFCAGAGWRVVWRDEFEAFDATKWNVAQTSDTAPPADPTRPRADCHGEGCILLGSCRDAACTMDSVAVRGGRLVLTSQRRERLGRNFTTGAVNTWGKAAWRADAKEGPFRLCVSAMLPGVPGGAAGVWPAHWLMPHDDSCDPDEGEMDIMEMIDGDSNVYSTYHWQTTYPSVKCSYPRNHSHVFTQTKLPRGWNETLHEFAVERGPEHIAFALDGVVTLNASANEGPQPRPRLWQSVASYLILNTAIGGGWPGSANASTRFPIKHEIDYVRVARPA
jgi:beta-glucanase (GH16 family)